MFELKVTDSTNDQPHSLNTQDSVKEAFPGEKLTFASVGGTITELQSYDPEDGSECVDATFTAQALGVYRLRCVATNGTRQVLIRVVDPKVLDAIPDPGFVVGHGQSAAPRLVLRSIANNCPDWRGDTAPFFDNRIRLADHGVVTR
jgi:hypothetical protein